MSFVKGEFTGLAGEALEGRRRVKIKSGTATDPPQVVYADAGEEGIGVTEYAVASGETVACMPVNYPGILEVEAVISAAVSRGTTLYGGDDGVVTDAVSGSPFGDAWTAAAADNEHIMVVPKGLRSTTAAAVSIADAGSLVAAATVEGAIQELAQHQQTAQAFVPIDLTSLILESGSAITAFAASAGRIIPGFNQISNKEIVLEWNDASAATCQMVAANVPLPPDLDPTAALEVHYLMCLTSSNNTPEITTEMYFGAGDTDCAGTDPEVVCGITLKELSLSAAPADVPTPPSNLTLIFGPKASELGTDHLRLYAVWLEYTRKTLTS